MIKVLLVDDHDLVRTGIRRLLEDVRGIRVVGEADSGEEAISQVRLKGPDVVLMDVTMPGIGGMEATRKLVAEDPNLKVIVCTIHTDSPFPHHLLQAGASGYVTKGSSVDEMVKAIREVHGGGRYISPEVATDVATSKYPDGASPFETLSHREMQLMLMLIQGQSQGQIAETLHLSPKTVSTYRHRLFQKLEVRTEAELTHLAGRYGMLDGVA